MMPTAVFYYAGVFLVSAVSIQVLLLVVSMITRMKYHSEHYQASLRLIEQQVELARKICVRREQESLSWNGVRKFVINKKIQECDLVYSFYLKPHDNKPLPAFLPGQYLTFQLKIPGEKSVTNRCYSLSDSYRSDCYRVTIKKVPRPDRPEKPWGLSSGFFHDHLRAGDILDVKAPQGHFTLDVAHQTPVVFIAGGVGLTPLLCMLSAVVDEGFNRAVWFFYGVRHRGEHAMKEYLNRLAARFPTRLHLHVAYSEPKPEDQEGTDFQHKGFISVDLLKQVLPSNNFEFYICGPPPMMKLLTAGLTEWNVPESKIFFEAFGPASVKKTAPESAPVEKAAAWKIQFGKSNVSCPWDAAVASILELAEQNGVQIDCGCRAGNCGTCVTVIKSGNVRYLREPGLQPEAGTCLSCISVPQSDLVLDA